MRKIRRAVIPAAGLGTRFLPATKDVPKEMLPVVDRPAIHYVVEDAVVAGCDIIYIITGSGKEAIQRYFSRAPELERVLKEKGKEEQLEEIQRISEMAEVVYLDQKEPKGLGHAVNCAKNHIGGEDFLVLLGDDIFLTKNGMNVSEQLIAVHKKYSSPVFAVQKVSKEDISKFGSIDGKKFTSIKLDGRVPVNLYRVNKLIEKPKPEEAPSLLATMGRYIFPPEIFEYLDKVKPSSRGEIELTDAMNEMNKDIEFIACEYDGKRYDLGDKVGWLIANIEVGLDREDIGPKLREYFDSPQFSEKLKEYEMKINGRKVDEI